jgi:UDP-N-acetylmuramoyl-L-alanyl-D-glutamate--2,6-diaminopimelate ligase
VERRLSEFFTPEIAKKAGLTAREGNADPLITEIEYDSRSVKSGALFFALPGLHTNGSLFIEDAISRGAVCVVHENEDFKKISGIVYLRVNNSRFAMSPVADSFYKSPSQRMFVTGVTGTEGKSTTVYLIWQLLSLMGKKAGFFSTVQRSFGGEALWNSEHQTTPEAPVVQRLLYEMADNGCEYAVVEASSHGLSEKTNRLGDVNFCSAVFTNVTHEHLEFHGTWEQYRNDKANLFRALDSYNDCCSDCCNSSGFKPFGVINADDKSAGFFAEAVKNKTFTYSCENHNANLCAETVENGAWGNSYRIFMPELNEHIELKDNLPGSFNMGNVIAAILTVSNLLNLPIREIAPHVSGLKPVRGRMTAINKGQPFEVVVDYAHTPSSFLAIFPPLRARLDKTGGKIIALFGSAGERDTQKRAEQGRIAARYSDFIIITDEDPRGEKPMDILEEIAKGIETGFTRDKNLFLIPSRPGAIRKALDIARSGDLVLLLGKGHENSIIYADHVMPYDEIAEAEKALSEMNTAC